MIGAGAIWAKDLWGSYWSWDPVETWSLVSWLIYGLTSTEGHLRVAGEEARLGLHCGALTPLSSVLRRDLVVSSSLHMFNVP